MIELTGTPTIGDYARFRYFHLYRRVWFIAIPMFIVLISLSIYSVVSMFDPRETAGAIAGQIGGFLVTTFWCYVMVVMPYRNAKKVSAAKSFGEPIWDGSRRFSAGGRPC